MQTNTRYSTTLWFSDIKHRNTPYKWNYSYKTLEDELQKLLVGKVLKKVFVNLFGYLEGKRYEKNSYDMSYIGGSCMLIFDNNIALELNIHADGMISHRVHLVEDLRFYTTKDIPPSDISSEYYFYDLNTEIELCYEKQTVCDIKVKRTDSYPFPLNGFDEKLAQQAEKRNELPSIISFVLSNETVLNLIPSKTENYYIEFDKDVYTNR